MQKHPIVFLILFVLSCSAPNTDPGKIGTKDEMEASYPGGNSAWLRFLDQNQKYPDEAVDERIQGTVVVKFLVDTAGNISDVQAISGPTQCRLREESVKVIKLSGKWIPAMQNGQKVQSYKKESLKYELLN